MATDSLSPNKSDFVRDYLQEHPGAKERDVIVAWQAAGHADKISPSLFYKVKNTQAAISKSQAKASQAKAAAKGTGRSAKPKAPVASETEAKPTRTKAVASTVFEDVEADIDRLLFKIMGTEGLNEVEDALRRVRRLVVRKHQG